MSGFSLCNSVSLRSCFSHSLICSLESNFLASQCSKTSTCITFAPQSRETLLKAQALLEKSNNGFRCFAVNKRRNDRGGLMESDGFDEDEDADADDDLDVAGTEDNDEGVYLPLEKMKKWLENKPRGFGVGKVYDTSVEDKLLNEIEQSRKAQAANLNKLKKEPLMAAEPKKTKGIEDTQNGIRVRLSNLPRKKNIHKDLKSAFKGVSGILDIIPVVSGSKKTRDPVCKGFAFVDFRTDADASRFIDLFSGENISFGKVQKQLKCQILNSSSSTSNSEQEDSDKDSDDEQELLDIDSEAIKMSFLDAEAESDIRKGDNIDAVVVEEELDVVNSDDDEENLKSAIEEKLKDFRNDDIIRKSSEEERIARIRELERRLLSKGKEWNNGDDGIESRKNEDQVEKKKKKKEKKKTFAKGQVKKVKKIEIPSSSKRLKVKEKAVLSKYAAKVASTSNE